MADVYMIWEFKSKLPKEDAISAATSEQSSREMTRRLPSPSTKQSEPDHLKPLPSSVQVSNIGAQLGVYATEVFSSGPLRSHMICGSVQKGHMSLWWFDRAGIIRTKLVDLTQSEGLECLIKLFYRLVPLRRRDWGFIYNTQVSKTPTSQRPKQQPARYPSRRTTKSAPPPSDLPTALDDSHALDTSVDSHALDASMLQDSKEKRENGKGKQKEDDERLAKFRRTNPFFGWTIQIGGCRVHIGSSVYRQYGLFSRGVYVADGQMDRGDGEPSDVVVKFSWQFLGLAQEADLTKRAEDAAKNGFPDMHKRLPRIYAHDAWNSTASGFRRRLNLGGTSGKDRQLFVLVAERLEHLATIKRGDDLKKVVVDVAHCESAFFCTRADHLTVRD